MRPGSGRGLSVLKIVSAKVIVTCPGRNFVTLKIETSDGITGLGDATLNGRELAVASYLTDHVIPCLIGRDAHHIEDIWQYLYRGAYWRRGPVTMSAIAAVDTALWDIKAKAAGLPLYQLLGGALPRRRDGLWPRQWHHDRGDGGAGAALSGAGLQGDPAAVGRAGPDIDLRRLQGPSYFYEPADADIPDRKCLVDREISALGAGSCSRRRATCWAGTCICCTTSITA